MTEALEWVTEAFEWVTEALEWVTEALEATCKHSITMGCTNWENNSATPTEIEVAIEKCIGVIEVHAEALSFAAPALQELHAVANEIDIELEHDRQYSRLYHQAVDKKDAMFGSAVALFYRVRRFIRRDLGSDSPEYNQIKDRMIASAKEEPLTVEDTNKTDDTKTE